METRLCVVGGGSWGTTIAALGAQSIDTVLWVRRPELAREINEYHTNSTYLGNVLLPDSLHATSDLEDALSGAEVIAMAVPARGMREVANRVAQFAHSGIPIMSLAKGLERGSLMRMSEVISDAAPGHPVAVLSGPNLAHEILVGQPAASVVACADNDIARMLQELFSRPTFRLYTNPDVIGCEIGGVVKNVVAIGAGIVQGFGFGDNTRATLVTRGLAEMSRLGVALGANVLTFAGLAGMGDVMATCSSSQSRNTSVGIRLGHGETISEIISSMKMVAEGVNSASSVLELARRHDVEMPITQQVSAVCEGEVSAADALRALMGRTNKPE
ncbi:MAG: NAD(P)H-dependent glycerol-3-phosphate dehydrogenase [Ilumatobacteraceae bacterium]